MSYSTHFRTLINSALPSPLQQLRDTHSSDTVQTHSAGMHTCCEPVHARQGSAVHPQMAKAKRPYIFPKKSVKLQHMGWRMTHLGFNVV